MNNKLNDFMNPVIQAIVDKLLNLTSAGRSYRGMSFGMLLFGAMIVWWLLSLPLPAPAAAIRGTKKVIALRVLFQDSPGATRYSRNDVIGLFDELDNLWQMNSYGNIAVTAEVSELFRL